MSFNVGAVEEGDGRVVWVDDRTLIDYYASDLADVAVYVLNSWLILQDARTSERKRELARVYIAETMPKIRGSAAVLQAINPAPIEAKDIILTNLT